MKLLIAPEARVELREAAAYYRAIASSRLAESFLADFERSAALLRDHPQIGTPYQSGSFELRRLGLRNFPFTLHYQTLADEIRILAVAHQRRRPGYWQKPVS